MFYEQLLILVGVLLLCHLVGDFCFVWQGLVESKTNFLLGPEGLGALVSTLVITVHSVIHSLLVCIALSLFWFFSSCDNFTALQIAALSVIIGFFHCVIDVLKALANVIINNPEKQIYWVLFGLDQFLHQIVLLWAVAMII